MQRVEVVITDLDDTLFNWFDQWHQSFHFLLSSVHKKLEPFGVSVDELEAETKKIHESVETSEYTFLIDELPSIKKHFPSQNPRDVFSEELREYKILRRKALGLYPGVMRTLQKLKSQGVKIIAYTESMEYHTIERLRILELDGVIDRLYSRDDHTSPEYIEKERLRTEPSGSYALNFTHHTRLSISHRKPAPEILDQILREAWVDKNNAIYIGDSASKDISMANEAGVTSILISHPNPKIADDRYELLRRVTHWTENEVETEKLASDKPTYTVGTFAEILTIFDFGEPKSRDADMLSAWQKSIDVQMHFNDIELRIRSLFASVLVGIVAGTGVLLATVDRPNFEIYTMTVNVAILSLLAIIMATSLFYMMDRHWYHRFLQGAVKNALEIEKSLQMGSIGFQLTNKIGAESRFSILKRSTFYWLSFLQNKHTGRNVRSSLMVSSDDRLEIFYKSILKTSLALLITLIIFGGVKISDRNILDYLVSNTIGRICGTTNVDTAP